MRVLDRGSLAAGGGQEDRENDLLLPLMVMQRPDRQTLTVSLGLLRGQYGAEPTLIAAGVVIGILPIVVVFLLAQEHLIKGMTQGAVK